MSVRGVRTRSAPKAPARAISDLAVIVRFGDLVVAVPAQRVVRIVLAEDVSAADLRGARPHVQIGDRALPAWDLGQLLGFAEEPAAWLVMTTSDEPGAPQIALGTGPCVAIAAHDAVAVLPHGVIKVPHAAVLGVFPTDPAMRAGGLGQLGVRIDPFRLIGPSALDAVAWSTR